jgi:hypothetical protein
MSVAFSILGKQLNKRSSAFTGVNGLDFSC